VLASVTCNVTVTTAPTGSVTEPFTALVLIAKLLVLAPELALLTTEVTLLASPVGRVSLKLAPLTVLPVVLLSTSVKLMVLPALTLPALAVLLMARPASGVTTTPAVPVTVLVPFTPLGRLKVAVLV